MAHQKTINPFGKGNYNHSLTVIGYHDDIQIDSTGNETGAFLIINSHIYWDDGYAWVPYSLFSTSSTQGGIGRQNRVYWMKVDEEFEIKYTIKATITCKSRDDIINMVMKL